MSDLKYIYHRTKPEHINGIISNKHIYNQIDRKKRDINCEYEGSKNRKIAKSSISLQSYKSEDYWKYYDEAIGIYFRPYLDKPKLKPGESAIVLDFQKIREDSINWLINTEENNGFYISKPGFEARTSFGGELGISYDETNWKLCKTNNLTNRCEVLLENSIYITPYLVEIISKEEVFSNT
jgi:hypothetical protein